MRVVMSWIRLYTSAEIMRLTTSKIGITISSRIAKTADIIKYNSEKLKSEVHKFLSLWVNKNLSWFLVLSN